MAVGQLRQLEPRSASTRPPVPAWTPQGAWPARRPRSATPAAPSTDSNPLLNDQGYCVQVRAIDTDAERQPGLRRLVARATTTTRPALHVLDPQPPHADRALQRRALLCPSYYVTPVNTDESQTPPVFVWKPVTGAAGYYIVVSRDPNFYEHPRLRVHQRDGLRARAEGPVTYADETAGSQLYWAVIPTAANDGRHGLPPAGRNLASLGNKQIFNKQSIAAGDPASERERRRRVVPVGAP